MKRSGVQEPIGILEIQTEEIPVSGPIGCMSTAIKPRRSGSEVPGVSGGIGRYRTTWTPISTTLSAGRRKKLMALVVLRAMLMNNFMRHGDISRLGVGIRV